MTLPFSLDVRVEPAGGKHGIQGKRYEERDQHGKGHGDSELEEEAAHDPFHERHRHKNGHDRKSRGQDGQADLTRFPPSPP